MSLTLTTNNVKVFVNNEGEYGNLHSIIFDESKKLNNKTRQHIAKKTGLSETVFINNKTTGDIDIFNPVETCPFAGSALLGTASFLNTINKTPLTHLISSGKKIVFWQKGKIIYIRMKKTLLPPWNYKQLENPTVVNNVTVESTYQLKHTVIWSWINKEKGIIRARTFASDWGIPEDEANGSGSMGLAAQLGQELKVHHGKGSIIYANSLSDEYAETGGKVIKIPSGIIVG